MLSENGLFGVQRIYSPPGGPSTEHVTLRSERRDKRQAAPDRNVSRDNLEQGSISPGEIPQLLQTWEYSKECGPCSFGVIPDIGDNDDPVELKIDMGY